MKVIGDAKRSVTHAYRSDAWESLTGHELRELIKRSAEYYDQSLDRDRVTRESRRHIVAVETSVAKTIDWLRNIDIYLQNVFDTTAYTGMEVNEPTYVSRMSNGPIVAVLPRNDRGDLAPYVIAQTLLAKSPAIIAPSFCEAGEYVANTYVQALSRAIADVLDDERATDVVDGICTIPSNQKRGRSNQRELITRVVPTDGQVILFGSDSTLEAIENRLQRDGTAVSQCIQMGTGTSASVVIDAEEAVIPRYCDAITRSAVFDKGDDCTATSLLYVLEETYSMVVDELHVLQDRITGGDPFDRDVDFAAASDAEFEQAQELANRAMVRADLSRDRLNVIQCRHSDLVCEYPLPVIQIKPVSDSSGLITTMKQDLDGENLVTSVFTSDEGTFDRLCHQGLPTHLLRHNAPTHEIDLMHEHQGTFLVQELMNETRVEKENRYD